MFLIEHDRALPDAPALVEAATGHVVSYERLSHRMARIADALRVRAKGVVLLLAQNTIPSIVTYLAAFRSGHAVLPIDADLDPVSVRALIDSYSPELLVAPNDHVQFADAALRADYFPLDIGEPSLAAWTSRASGWGPVHQDLSLLLTTSGSTGNAKLVRLSARNILSNAEAIRQFLDIGSGERAITSLAPFYSYGLSVLHSHLLAGASVLVTTRTIVEREFWDSVRLYGCTSCAAVPYMYDAFRHIGFERLELPTLRTLTQAGGKLADPLIRRFHEIMTARGGRLMVMYGQTEATARIACLPAHLLPMKVGSVGFPMAGGSLTIEMEDGSLAPPRTVGEVIYSGPNVMLGYATGRADLARGDETGGVLHTGDWGYLDDDACLFIVGRLKRFAKVFGLRVNLDDVEGQIHGQDQVAVLDGGDVMIVCCAPAAEAAVRGRVRELAQRMRLHASAFRLHLIYEVPLLPNGKVDYQRLAALAGGGPPTALRSRT